MEGTPQLLTDVKFSQHRRGYDPDEVDNFLERVSAAVAQLQDKLRQATERAEMADSQLAEARRLQAEAEARTGTGGVVTGPALDADEELKKVLVMAQRAADQAVAEANTTATKTVADARSKALALLVEAEADRDRMMEKARKKADATAEERAQTLRDQVVALEAAKVDLEADVAALDGHLATETERLRVQLASIQAGLDDPHGLRLATSPPLNDTPVPVFASEDDPDEPATSESSGSAVTDLQEGPASEGADGTPGDEAVRSGDAADDGDPLASGIDTGGEAQNSLDLEVGADADAPSQVELIPIGSPADEEETAPGIDDGSDGDDQHIDLTGSDASEVAATADGGLPTELFTPPVSEAPAAGSALGEPDAAADAAMRAFFEQDLDEDPTTSTPRPRFGRRR